MKYILQCAEEFASIRGTLRQQIYTECPNGGQLMFVALNEAVNNAFCYGCDDYQTVEVEMMLSPSEIMLRVAQHSGSICARNQSRELPEDDLADHGRGLAIMRHCVDSLEFDNNGRSVILRKYK